MWIAVYFPDVFIVASNPNIEFYDHYVLCPLRFLINYRFEFSVWNLK